MKKFPVFVFSFFLLVLFGSGKMYAQSTIENVRFHLWESRDAYPGLTEAQDLSSGEFDYPVNALKTVAPKLIGGMVYGWNFIYTPSDKARGVDEYFELEEIQPFNTLKSEIDYEQPWLDESRLNAWVHYRRTPNQIQNFKLWSSIQNPKISGRGYGDLEKGFDGIDDAIKEAAKEAIREHFRNEIKNKPKEISGSILIRKDPTLGIVSGRYTINLDFFLESVKIVSYTTF